MSDEPSERHPPIPYFPREAITPKVAAYQACVSIDTIVRWAVKHGLGRQVDGPRSGWKISAPALAMHLAQDNAALNAYRAGDRESETVLRYFDLVECPRPQARKAVAA